MLVALVPFAPAKAVFVRAPYEGSSALSYGGLDDCADPVRGIGVVCVDIPRGAHDLDVRVSDLHGLVVGGSWYTHAADGSLLGMGSYCDSLTTPLSGAEAIIVVRVEAGNGALQCLNEGEAASGPATKGIVSLRFR